MVESKTGKERGKEMKTLLEMANKLLNEHNPEIENVDYNEKYLEEAIELLITCVPYLSDDDFKMKVVQFIK